MSYLQKSYINNKTPISVKEFGVVGDGVAVENTALQAAINSVGSAGGVLFFPAGTYKVTTPLTLSSATGMIFQGVGGKSIISATVSGILLNLSSTTNCHIRDLTISGSHQGGIQFQGGTGGSVSKCDISGNSVQTGGGIIFNGATYCTAADNVCHGNLYGDIVASPGNDQSHLTIKGNKCNSVGCQVNIHFYNTSWAIIEENECSGSTVLSPPDHGGYGIMIYLTALVEGFAGTNQGHHTITGNTIHDTQGTGIYLQAQSESSVVGNVIDNVATVQTDNLLMVGGIAANLGNTSITGNVITNSGRHGIAISGNSPPNTFGGMSVVGNRINSCGSCGIFAYKVNDCAIDGNTIDTVTQHGIRLYDVNRCNVAGNVVVSPTQIGIFGDSQGSLVDTTITNNSIYNAGGVGLHISCPMEGGAISSNTIRKTGVEGLVVFPLSSTATGVDISGNSIVDAGQTTNNTYQGLYLRATINCRVRGNTVRKTLTNKVAYGIFENSNTGASIESNTVDPAACNTSVLFSNGTATKFVFADPNRPTSEDGALPSASGATNLAAIQATVAASSNVLHAPGTYAVASGTIGASATIKHTFRVGAILKPATSAALVLRGQIDAASNQQIFDCSNSGASVTLTDIKRVSIDWFGAKPDGSTDCGPAITAAIAALGSNGGEIYFSGGNGAYITTQQLDITGLQSLTFIGHYSPNGGAAKGSQIQYTGTAASFLIGNNAVGITLQQLEITYTNAAFAGKLLNFDSSTGMSLLKLSTCLLGGTVNGLGTLLSLSNVEDITIDHVQFTGGAIGIDGPADVGHFCNNLHMSGGGFGSLSFKTALVRNVAAAWSFKGVSWEPIFGGSAASISGTYAGMVGVTIEGCWFGDITNGGTHIRASGVGISIIANYFSGDTATTIIDVQNNCHALTIKSNAFLTALKAISLPSGTPSRDVDISANIFDTCTEDIHGTPAGGIVVDSTGKRTIYGPATGTQFTANGTTGLTVSSTAITPALNMTWASPPVATTIGLATTVSGTSPTFTFAGSNATSGHTGGALLFKGGQGGVPGTDSAGGLFLELGTLVGTNSQLVSLQAGAIGVFGSLNYANGYISIAGQNSKGVQLFSPIDIRLVSTTGMVAIVNGVTLYQSSTTGGGTQTFSGIVALPSTTTINGTAALAGLKNTVTVGATVLTIGGHVDTNVTVTGAVFGTDLAVASPTSTPDATIDWCAWVSATDTVTVRVAALTSLTTISTTYTVRVIKQ